MTHDDRRRCSSRCRCHSRRGGPSSSFSANRDSAPARQIVTARSDLRVVSPFPTAVTKTIIRLEDRRRDQVRVLAVLRVPEHFEDHARVDVRNGGFDPVEVLEALGSARFLVLRKPGGPRRRCPSRTRARWRERRAAGEVCSVLESEDQATSWERAAQRPSALEARPCRKYRARVRERKASEGDQAEQAAAVTRCECRLP